MIIIYNPSNPPMLTVSIIGKSNCGKTTLIERLIPRLKTQGFEVATVKHDAHNFEIDKEGKDSWRHKNAGAKMTIVSSASKIAIFTDTEKDNSLEDICNRYINGVDIVLIEGYRMSRFPKIEVLPPGGGNDLLCGKDDNLVAVVTDSNRDYGVPTFNRDDIHAIVDMIIGLGCNKP